jgi:hypothetical protein
VFDDIQVNRLDGDLMCFHTDQRGSVIQANHSLLTLKRRTMPSADRRVITCRLAAYQFPRPV